MQFSENITDKVMQWIISDYGNYHAAADWYRENADAYRNKADLDEAVKRYVEDTYIFGDVKSIDANMRNEILQTALAYVNWNEITDAFRDAAENG